MARYDEFLGPDATPRPHQRELAEFLSELNSRELEGIQTSLRSRLREQEVSYNLLGAPGGTSRPWRLDFVPHLLPAEDFQLVARGLEQRARLWSLCLEDLYGPQRLLREGVVPVEAVLGNPHYFRALRGVLPAGAPPLVLYAADVVRLADGSFQVHSDRTAAPTGMGYALENRLALGQVLADPFRGYRVRRLSHFFDAVRQSLVALSPSAAGAPRVVLLTPGTRDESSFEHGYLARYQGLQLVEGRDLTVRGEAVFLKTLEGLQQVDVILRRVSDDWCDPLELREDSYLGVPGLVGAVRAGRVAVANPLGSGVVESPALRAYAPAIARALGVGPLLLDSIPTRHLADPRQLEEVLDTLDGWLLRPAYEDRRGPPEVAADLGAAEREGLRARLLAAPERWVAERWPLASSVPVGLGLTRRGALSLRFFACQVPGGFDVMPGALGRVDDTPDGLFLHAAEGASTKDVWVPGGEREEQAPLPAMPEARLEIRRGGVDLPSRLFDDIYWLGRVGARVNASARLLRAGLEPVVSVAGETSPALARALVGTMASFELLSPSALAEGQGLVSPALERALLSAIYDPERPSSIRACLSQLHELTSAARSRLSVDAWTTLRRVTSLYAEVESDVPAEVAFERLDELILAVAAFHGITDSNMVRGHAWLFIELGRRIEHGAFVLTLLARLFPEDGSREQMEALLRICDSMLTYRSRYLSTLQAAPVVDLVLTDETNPQSVVFQVKRLLACVRELPRERPFPLGRAEQRLVTLEARLMTADLEAACAGDAADLRDLAEEAANLLWQVSDDLTQTYFTHAVRPRAVAVSVWEDPSSEAPR